MEVNSRVGTILSFNEGILKFIGYGTYVGYDIPDAKGSFTSLLKEQGIKNPKIMLDNGKVVYGCECWWVEEGKVDRYMKMAKQIINVDIDDVRKKSI